MVVAAFPIVKLIYLAVRQVSKPIANVIKDGAKKSPFFRKYVCMPPAQLYHWVEVNIKMKMLNLGSPTQVPKLNEAMATELGADILGESVIFIIGAGCALAEYWRSSRSSERKENEMQQRLTSMEDKIVELEFRLGEQTARVQQLNREVYHKHSILKKLTMTSIDCDPHTSGHLPRTDILNEAIRIANSAMFIKVERVRQ